VRIWEKRGLSQGGGQNLDLRFKGQLVCRKSCKKITKNHLARPEPGTKAGRANTQLILPRKHISGEKLRVVGVDQKSSPCTKTKGDIGDFSGASNGGLLLGANSCNCMETKRPGSLGVGNESADPSRVLSDTERDQNDLKKNEQSSIS